MATSLATKRLQPAEDAVRATMATLAATYHGRGAVELGDPFKVLISTIISQRTREEQTTIVSARVFRAFPDAASLATAIVGELQAMLRGALYPEVKALRLIETARLLVERFGGQVPNNIDALLALPGVGRKTANCVLIYAFDVPALCVDTHMHRISNRLGWVTTQTPEQTERVLAGVLPRELWIGSNRLFLQHGRAICVPSTPICRVCPVRRWCDYGNAPDTPKR